MTDSAPSDQRFAQIVLAAFRAAGRYTDEQVRAAGGPSSTTMTGFRKAAAGEQPLRKVRGDTFDAIEAAAGWLPGSARRVYEGTGEPLLPEPGTVRVGVEAAPRRPVTDVPVGAGVDPGVLADLTDDETAKVLDFVAMIKAARKD